MNRDEKARLAWSFWNNLNEQKVDEAFALLHEQGSYRPNSMQSWEDIPNSSGLVQQYMRIMLERIPMRFDLADTLVDGDNVALEFTCYHEFPDGGGIYDQRYCMIMTIRDGKILRIREFLDTEMELLLHRYVMPDVIGWPVKYGRARATTSP